MSWPSAVACVLAAAWLVWEYQQRRNSADSNKHFCAELFGTATWTGVWLLQVSRAQQSNVRTEVLKATEGVGSPSELAQALMTTGKPRVIAHLAGPMELSKQQALDWIEQLGPRLAKMRLPDHYARSNEQVFALAYASDRRPPSQQCPAQILDHLVDSFGGSLVCCAKGAARWPWGVRLVRYGLGFVLLALLLVAFRDVLTPRPAPSQIVERVHPALRPNAAVSNRGSASRTASEVPKATQNAPVAGGAAPAKPVVASEAEAAPPAPKRDKPHATAKKEQPAAAVAKQKPVAGPSQAASTAQPANAQKSGEAKTNGK